MSDNGGFTIATESGIAMFRHLQLIHALALEINTGMRMSSRGSVMMTAREVCGSSKRTKKGVLGDYVKFVISTVDPDFQPAGTVKRALGL